MLEPDSGFDESISLTFEERRKSRLRLKLESYDLARFLPRGKVVRDGEVLLCKDGRRVRVEAASECVSQGLESAVVEGVVTSEEDTLQWIGGLMKVGIGQLDLPLLVRLYHCWQNENPAQVISWNESLAGYRETNEFLLEDQQMGRALLRILLAEDIPEAHQWPKTEVPCFATMFALAGTPYDINIELLLQGFTWSWMENQVGIATKVIPLGQTAAQRILRQLIPRWSGRFRKDGAG